MSPTVSIACGNSSKVLVNVRKYSSSSNNSLLAGSPVGLKSKRFVLEILLARKNRGEGTGEEGGKGEPAGNPRVCEYTALTHERGLLTG